MRYLAAIHWLTAAWSFLSSHFGSIAGFVAGILAQRYDTWRKNRKLFKTQVERIGYRWSKARREYCQMIQLLDNYYDQSNQKPISTWIDEYKNILKHLLRHLDRVKSGMPDFSVIYEFLEKNGLNDYEQLQDAIENMEDFAKLDFTKVAILTPEERKEKLALFDAVKDPFTKSVRLATK